MSENGNPTKIDAIKELIFGQNIKETDARFNKIEKLIADNKSSADAKSKAQHQKLVDDLKEHKQAYQKTIKGLEKEIEKLKNEKTERSSLRTLLLELAEKL